MYKPVLVFSFLFNMRNSSMTSVQGSPTSPHLNQNPNTNRDNDKINNNRNHPNTQLVGPVSQVLAVFCSSYENTSPHV